jgi:hypothetical protein
MDINEAMGICLFKGIKVFPEISGKSFVVAIKEKTNPAKLGEKHYTSRSINDAITSTYIFIAIKIKSKT